MKNPLLKLTARAAEAAANSQPKENGFWPGGCMFWSYEPKMPASMTQKTNIDCGPDEPMAG